MCKKNPPMPVALWDADFDTAICISDTTIPVKEEWCGQWDCSKNAQKQRQDIVVQDLFIKQTLIWRYDQKIVYSVVTSIWNETCEKAPITGNLSLPDLTGYTYQGEEFVEGVFCGSWLSPPTRNMTYFEYYAAEEGQFPMLWTEPGKDIAFIDFQNREQKSSVFEPPDHLDCEWADTIKIYYDFPKLWKWHGINNK